jgi:integrase
MLDSTALLLMTIPWKPIPWPEFRAEFIAQYQPPLAARATLDKMRHILEQIEGLGVTSTAQLDADLLVRFIAGRPPESPHTTRGLLINLRVVCYYAEARRYLMISPYRLRKLSKLIRVPAPTRASGQRRHNSREEVRRVLDLLKWDTETKQGWPRWRARRLYALVATVALTGLRAREAQRLWVVDVDLGKGIIDLTPRTATGLLKTDASVQPIAMPRALGPILTDWSRHRLDSSVDVDVPPAGLVPWMFPGSRRTGAWIGGSPGQKPVQRLSAVAARAGVEGMTFASLRRTWATAAESAGIPQALITRQLRHSSEETTKRWYQQRDLDSLGDAIDGFDY